VLGGGGPAEKIAIPFHRCQKGTPLKPQVKFDSLDIVYKPETNILDIYFRHNMIWDVHTKSLSSTLSKIILYYMISKICKEPTLYKYLSCTLSCPFEVWFDFLGRGY
jgi:hypothetical protein